MNISKTVTSFMVRVNITKRLSFGRESINYYTPVYEAASQPRKQTDPTGSSCSQSPRIPCDVPNAVFGSYISGPGHRPSCVTNPRPLLTRRLIRNQLNKLLSHVKTRGTFIAYWVFIACRNNHIDHIIIVQYRYRCYR